MKEISRRNAEAFRLACCGGRAVPKTGINGVQFFAHMSGVCSTAPEIQWHIDSKDIIAGLLSSHNIPFQLEFPGSSGRQKWVADIYAEIGQRRVVIELQYSYQVVGTKRWMNWSNAPEREIKGADSEDNKYVSV